MAALAREIDPLRGRGVLRARLRRRAAHHLSQRAQAAAGAHADASGAAQPMPAAARVLGRALHRSMRPIGDGRGLRRAASTGWRESVRLRMISEVPLGAFLSGGVDSSAVVAMMAGVSSEPGEHLLDRVRRSGVRRSRVRADGGRALPHRPFRRDRRERRLRSDRHPRRAATTSPMPTARRSPPTASASLRASMSRWRLSGDGGDESFGGYRRYRLHMMEERMRAAMPLGAAPAAVRRARPLCTRRPTGRRACSAPRPRSRRMARNSVEAYFHSMSILREPMRGTALQRRASSARSAATTRARSSSAMPRAPTPTIRWR